MKNLLMTLSHILFTLFMYAMCIIFFGLAAAPGVGLILHALQLSSDMPDVLRFACLGMSLAAAYFLFGLTLIILAGGVRTILRLRLKEGTYRLFSWGALKWSFLSCLYLLINFTFIDFVLLTPFANVLLRLLGARLGRNVQVNSRHVYDASLLEIGDNTVIGGGAIIIGHVVERGILKLKKVKIGKNVTIGSHATVMPGCEIGDNALIGAGAVLLKNSQVEPRSVWYGMPARNVRRNRGNSNNRRDSQSNDRGGGGSYNRNRSRNRRPRPPAGGDQKPLTGGGQ